jgi:hypothetical protein
MTALDDQIAREIADVAAALDTVLTEKFGRVAFMIVLAPLDQQPARVSFAGNVS